MKWVSLAFALLGALALGVSGHFWQELLDSADFKFVFFLSQVGHSSTDASSADWSGLMFLRSLPAFSYAGAALSVAGAGLVVTKGRVAAIPLFVGPALLLLPLGWGVISIPSLSAYLFAELVGIPSVLAGLAALFVRPRARASSPQGAETKAGWVRKKQLGLAAGAVAALGLLLMILAGRRGATSDDEVLYYPGPVAFSSNDLLALAEGPLQPGLLVAAEWDGVWFAGRVLSATNEVARIRFVGWESGRDEDLTRDRLRSLPDNLVPKVPAGSKMAAATLGTTSPTPCAFVLSLYQPEAGIEDRTRLSDLPAKQTLYSQRLDLSDVSLDRALTGSPIKAGKPFALGAAGTLRVKVAGPHYFAATSNGATRLWVDDQQVTPGSAVQLDSGAHDLRVDHRHDGGPRLTLRVLMGTTKAALRALDLNRDGVAQFAQEEDGRVRVVLDEGLLFDFDRDNLKPSAERALSSIYARSIAPVPSAPISIEGHTDATGTAEHNLELSRRRAECVRGWLTAHGRSSSGLGIQPYGEKRPRVPNDTDAHRRLNRRVELVIGPDSAGTASAQTSAALSPAALAATTSPSASPAGETENGARNQAVLDVLHAYYRELNDGNFDANRYFEPSVDRYITMLNTSTAAMNNYIRNIFPKQFKEHQFELEEGSVSEESAGQYVYVERSRYIQAGKQQTVEKRVKVRIRLSPGGKLLFLHQFQKL